jgi:LysM repeat protein
VHVVGEGQTLWGISEAYEVPLSEIMALNRLTEDSIIRPGDEIVVVRAPIQANAQPEGPVIHTVALGQTLFEIALTYGVDLQTVLDLNGLTETSIIRPGDEIVVVPAPGETYPRPKPAIVHTVEPGQTLLEIALIYGVELQTLLELNNLSADSLIMPGDQILIRPADPTPVPTEQAVPSPTPDIVQTQSAEALRIPTPRLDEPPAGPEGALEQESRARRPLLIAVLVVVALLGAGLLVAGIVLKPVSRQEEPDD